MEDGTYRCSLQTVFITALGILLIGAGCAGKVEPPQQQEQKETVQAPAAVPLPQEVQKAPVPFVACYRGEADLFSSTSNVMDVWQDQIREQLNNGWLIDIWCKEQSESGAFKYAFAFRKSQGLSSNDLKAVKFTYQHSGRTDGGPKLESENEAGDWSLVRLGYVSSERNRANEIPLLLSDVVAINNQHAPFDSIAFSRDLQDVDMAPRNVVAEMHGGDQKGWFSARFVYSANSKELKTETYCRTYFDSEDGGFSPQDMKSECNAK